MSPAGVRGSPVACKLLMGYLRVAGGHLHPPEDPHPHARWSHCHPSLPAHARGGISSAYFLLTLPSSQPPQASLCLELFLSFFSFTGAFPWFFKALLEGALLLQEAFSASPHPPRRDGAARGILASISAAAFSAPCSSVPGLSPSKGSKVGLCLIHLWVPRLSLGLAQRGTPGASEEWTSE